MWVDNNNEGYGDGDCNARKISTETLHDNKVTNINIDDNLKEMMVVNDLVDAHGTIMCCTMKDISIKLIHNNHEARDRCSMKEILLEILYTNNDAEVCCHGKELSMSNNNGKDNYDAGDNGCVHG